VHYRGEAPMWIDVGSGSVQAGSGSYAAASGVLQSGNGRAIAVPTKTRMRKLPDVPTFLEQGISDIAFQVQGFICLVGPAAMPKDIVKKLSDMMVEGGKSERIQKILDTFGIDTAAQDSAFFEKILAEQGPVWIKLVKDLNLEPQ
jgi:tripartite-type tricarboxylate transporter receptor subunit TctC